MKGANEAETKGGDGRRNLSDGKAFSNERHEAVSFDKRFLLSDRMCMLKNIHHIEVVLKRSMADSCVIWQS